MGPVEGFGHTAADILLSDVLVKFSLMHSHRRLFPCPTKYELSPGCVHAVGKILQCLQAGGIDSCHIAKPKNNDRRQIGQTIYDHIDLVS